MLRLYTSSDTNEKGPISLAFNILGSSEPIQLYDHYKSR